DCAQGLVPGALRALRSAPARPDRAPVAPVLSTGGALPGWVRRAVPGERLRTVQVGGLSLGATHELVRNRLGITFARPVLIKLWETSGGNPFFALELAAALQRRGGTLSAGEELPPDRHGRALACAPRRPGCGRARRRVYGRGARRPDDGPRRVGGRCRLRGRAGRDRRRRRPRAGRGSPQVHSSTAGFRGRRAPDSL